MTTEEIAELAKEIADAEWPIEVYGPAASLRCVARLIPILTEKLSSTPPKETEL